MFQTYYCRSCAAFFNRGDIPKACYLADLTIRCPHCEESRLIAPEEHGIPTPEDEARAKAIKNEIAAHQRIIDALEAELHQLIPK